jgi:hypothetical protein
VKVLKRNGLKSCFLHGDTIKQGATDYNQYLSELEIHTTRIYVCNDNKVV